MIFASCQESCWFLVSSWIHWTNKEDIKLTISQFEYNRQCMLVLVEITVLCSACSKSVEMWMPRTEKLHILLQTFSHYFCSLIIVCPFSAALNPNNFDNYMLVIEMTLWGCMQWPIFLDYCWGNRQFSPWNFFYHP